LPWLADYESWPFHVLLDNFSLLTLQALVAFAVGA
jgi:hypothetical protein